MIVTDPCEDEEALCSGQVTVVTKEKGEIVFIHKHGNDAVPDEHVQTCLDLSKPRSALLKTLVDAALGNKGT